MYESSISIDNVIEALAAFITQFTPGAEIIRGQSNRTPMPTGPCVVLTELFQANIDLPYATYSPPTLPIPAKGVAHIHGPTKIDIQADFYGVKSGEYCRAVKSAISTGWGYSQFPGDVKPLYADDGRQAPLIDGEQQYESRWILIITLQYNPVVDVEQEFAEDIVMKKLYPVDV